MAEGRGDGAPARGADERGRIGPEALDDFRAWWTRRRPAGRFVRARRLDAGTRGRSRGEGGLERGRGGRALRRLPDLPGDPRTRGSHVAPADADPQDPGPFGCACQTSEQKVSSTYKARRASCARSTSRQSIAHFTWNGTWLPEEARRLVRRRCWALRLECAEAARRPPALPERPTLRDCRTPTCGTTCRTTSWPSRPHEHGARPRGAHAVPRPRPGRLRPAAAGGVSEDFSRRNNKGGAPASGRPHLRR